MTIHNQLFSDISNLDLKLLIQDKGPPHYPTKRNPVGNLNEDFWAEFIGILNEIIYENREDQFYKYGGRIFERFSTHLLTDQLSNDILRAAQTWPGYGVLAQLRNAKHLSGVFTHLKGKVQCEGVFSRRRNYIHVNNGVLDLSGRHPKLVAFSPKWISRNLIPVDYAIGAKCKRFLDELLKPLTADDINVLQKLIGMFLGGVNFLQKILILEGAPGSGKSALAAAIRLLIGEVNCGELRTAHLAERFEKARYMAKTLLIGADVAGDFLNQPGAHELKKMTGGDWVDIERKYSNQECAVLGVFCVLITCNSRLTVKLDGDRGAWLRRLVLLLYDQRRHLTDIPGFAQQLVQAEGSGILNWAIEGLQMANEDVEKTGTITLSVEQRKRVEALLDESEGLRLFVTNHIKADPAQDLTTDEIIQKYSSYCSAPERGWNINMISIQRQLPSLMMQLFKTPLNTNILRNNKRHRGYRYVDFKP